jgi:hypothetical protein
VETFTLTRIAGEEAPVDLTTAGTTSGTDPLTLSGSKSAIPAGYYLLRAVVKNSAGASAGRSEVVHIYQNLAAEAAYVFTDDDFRVSRVTSTANSGPGTLRQALTDALAITEGPQTIQVVLEPGAVITLTDVLPQITKSITIEGNGVTLTPSASWTSNYDSQLLYIYTAAIVRIRGIHFKDGLATDFGAAIQNEGILILESCIFSGNRTTSTSSSGGVMYSGNTLTIRGCTFYNNSSIRYGGAVYFYAPGKTLTLTGNLFYGNTATSYPVVYCASGTVSASYNVVDVALGTTSSQAGWTAGTGDKTTLNDGDDLTIAGDPFDTTSFVPVAGLQSFLATAPADFPLTDFYGTTRTFPDAPGAVAKTPGP